MRKKRLQSFICSSLILLSLSAHAQLDIVKKPKIILGINFLYAAPQGDFKKTYQYGGGGEVYAGVALESTYITATVGVSGFKAQPGNSAGTLTAVPVKAGLKRYFLLKRLFINGDAGLSAVKVNNNSSGAFTAGLGAGVRLFGIEAALYYNAFKKPEGSGYNNSLNAKIGWSFSL